MKLFWSPLRNDIATKNSKQIDDIICTLVETRKFIQRDL